MQACDSSSILLAIKQFYQEKKLDLQKMVMFTSDGASVILGKVNGVAAKLKLEVPHLVQQHCVAHREDLGISDTWKEIKLMRDIDTFMRTVYTIFSRSSVKRHESKEIVEASENEAIAFRPLSEVRWLSRHFALQAIIRNYEGLISYFEKDTSNDQNVNYCRNKLTNGTFKVALHVLADVLEEMASLCKILQRSNLTPLDSNNFAREKINKIRNQYLEGDACWSDRVNALLKQEETETVDTQPLLNFINCLCIHLEDRFPENKVQEWSVFDISSISHCDFSFGIEHVNALCLKYHNFLANAADITNQFNDFKFSVQERIKSKLISNFVQLVVFALQYEQFFDLAKLLDIGGTFLASSADCERGFSLMNQIKNKLRNRLGEYHLDMLMRVKSYQLHGNSINLDTVYKEWMNSKDRREKK